MIWFAIATLTPAVLLGLGALLGGAWPMISVLSITFVVFVLDRFVPKRAADTTNKNGLWVNILQVLAHACIWVLGIWAIGGSDHLSPVNAILLIIGVGLYFGQISNSNAHELIHASMRLPRRLGMAVYCSILFGHHASAHMRVHHIHAATEQDPNTARYGEGFWRYVLRAWPAGFIEGKRAEDRLRKRNSTTQMHPYVGYCAGSAAACLLALWIGGITGLLVLCTIVAYAQIQLYLSDYVQHYGLLRDITPEGKRAPMGPEHSWNAPHWYSSAMMLNAPRHSDHHANPSKAYTELQLSPENMPMLPHSLPMMAVVALIPPLWRRIMDHRVLAWRRAIA